MVKTAKHEMLHELRETVYKFFPKNVMKEEELYEESKEYKTFVDLKERFIKTKVHKRKFCL